METPIEQQLTLRQQALRAAGSLNDPRLLQELLDFIAQLQARDTPAPKGSVQALMPYFGTLPAAAAEEMQAVIDREFSTVEKE